MSSDESVLSPHASDNEVKALQERVREYEAALRSAAPRLAAFKRLEELARIRTFSLINIISVSV